MRTPPSHLLACLGGPEGIALAEQLDGDEARAASTYAAVCLLMLAGQRLANLHPDSHRMDAGTILAQTLDGSLPARAGLHPIVSNPCPWPVLHRMTPPVEQAALHASRMLGEHGAELTPYWPTLLVPTLVAARERRRLGAFYTPRWLVEYVLEIARWPQPHEHLLDPTCGTGAFVVAALQAVRRAEPELGLAQLVERVRGYDIDPLAVLAARVAYVLAVADVLPSAEQIRLPVEMRDLSEATRQPSPVHVLVGNPPWIRWSDLQQPMQQRVALLAKQYKMLPPQAFHGGSELDLAAVLATHSTIIDLAAEGRACFVLPSSLLRAPAAACFRQALVQPGGAMRLRFAAEFGSVRVFADAGKETAVMAWSRGSRTPQMIDHVQVDRARWSRMPGPEVPWSQAQSCFTFTHGRLVPSGAQSRLLAASKDPLVARLEGECDWLQGRKGVTTDLNSAYFVRLLGPGSHSGSSLVVNDVVHDKRGHLVPVHQFEVENELLFPLIKGAGQLHRYVCDRPSAWVIVPNRSVRRGATEEQFAAQYPLAHAHFRWVQEQTEGALSRRSSYRRALGSLPFFFIYNVGPYTFAPWKVAWAEISSRFCASVVGPVIEPRLGELSAVLDHKVYFAACDDERCADFVCAFLNSQIVRERVEAVRVRLQTGALLHQLKVPAFDPSIGAHRELAALGNLARRGEDRQRHIDELARAVLDMGSEGASVQGCLRL